MALEDSQFIGAEAVVQFEKIRPHYRELAKYICGIITEYCGKTLIQATEYRAKSIESFQKKCEKTEDDGTRKYTRPLEELTDLAGVRAIVYLRDSVDPVCAEIKKRFDVIEEIDVGERVYSEGKFGYQSKHLIVRLGSDRKFLDENKAFADMVCEVQVRTLLQHAWAAIDHRIQYKTGSTIPLEIRKRFSALAGALELADRELQRIDDDAEGIRNEVRKELEKDITQQSLLLSSEGTDPASAESTSFLAVRELIRQGKYTEAISIYTQKLRLEPQALTLLLGRARAKFLIGDTHGAFADLDAFDAIQPDDPASQKFRQLFESGDIRQLKEAAEASTAPKKYSSGLKRAGEALESGNGVQAFEEYAALEAQRYNKAYCYFGMAMACALEGDNPGANNFMEKLKIIPATPMAVNLLSLKTIICRAEGEDDNDLLTALKDARTEFPDYNLQSSALSQFLEGFGRRHDNIEIKDIYTLLR